MVYGHFCLNQHSPVATGGFGGLSSPDKTPSTPEMETWNTINQRSLSIFAMSSPPAQTKTPYWRRFWNSSVSIFVVLAFWRRRTFACSLPTKIKRETYLLRKRHVLLTWPVELSNPLLLGFARHNVNATVQNSSTGNNSNDGFGHNAAISQRISVAKQVVHILPMFRRSVQFREEVVPATLSLHAYTQHWSTSIVSSHTTSP